MGKAIEFRKTALGFAMLLFVLLPGCRTAAATGLTAAQQVLSGFSLHAMATFDGELAVNSTFVAIDAKVDATLTYRAPLIVGGAPAVVWERKIEKDSGQRAYKVVFSGQEGTKFIQIFKVSWGEARTQMPYLKPPHAGAVVERAPLSPKIAIEESPDAD